MSNSSYPMRVSYDRNSDVLYLSARVDEPARTEEDRPGLLWRYSLDEHRLIGLTVVDFAEFWNKHHRSELLDELVGKFKIQRKQAQELLNGID